MLDVTEDIVIHTEMFEDILEDGNIPRSIKEIKSKYNLSFPFQVKQVLTQNKLEPMTQENIIMVPGFSYVTWGDGSSGIEVTDSDEDDGYEGSYSTCAETPVWIFYR